MQKRTIKVLPNKKSMRSTITKQCMRSLVCAATLSTLACVSARADWDDVGPHYEQINLVSDIAGAAQIQDTNMVNAWGISYKPGAAFWISDNGAGKATLYSV